MITNYQKFLEVRFSDVVKIKNDGSDVTSNINKMVTQNKDFSGSLRNAIPLKNSPHGKTQFIYVDYNDTAEHNLRERIKDRTNFKSTDEFNHFFREFLNEIFPQEFGKTLNQSGRYSLYSVEHNFSLIVYFNYEKWVKGRMELTLITILPERKGLDVIDIIDI